MKNLSKSAKYWELFFQFASPDIIETQDYEKAAISLFSAAGQNRIWKKKLRIMPKVRGSGMNMFQEMVETIHLKITESEL